MTKARRVIAESMPSHDVVIEVLDARMPRASENPVVTELRRHKPCLKVLCKSDLADAAITTRWIRHFEEAPQADPGFGQPAGKVLCLALTTERPSEARQRVPELCRKLTTRALGPGKAPVRAMIVGIPNVGKSTLINTLMNRKVAKVGNEPAVTRTQQLVTLANGMQLSDNPGLLWPKIDDETASYCLAFAGSIPDSAIDYEAVTLWGAGLLLARYPNLVAERYKLTVLPETPAALLAEIGRRRGALRAGGVLDMHKASDALLHEFRAGTLGRISLETPDDLP
jgi:ribosome biogenesis GTPase A